MTTSNYDRTNELFDKLPLFDELSDPGIAPLATLTLQAAQVTAALAIADALAKHREALTEIGAQVTAGLKKIGESLAPSIYTAHETLTEDDAEQFRRRFAEAVKSAKITIAPDRKDSTPSKSAWQSPPNKLISDVLDEAEQQYLDDADVPGVSGVGLAVEAWHAGGSPRPVTSDDAPARGLHPATVAVVLAADRWVDAAIGLHGTELNAAVEAWRAAGRPS